MDEAEELGELRKLVVDMARKLETLPVIEQAKGVLVERTGCTPEEAFDTLREMSMRENRKLRDVAAGLVTEAVRSR